MNQRLLQLARILFIGLDILVLNAMLFIGKWWFDNSIPDAYDIEYDRLTLFINVTWLVVSWLNSIYQTRFISSFEIFTHKTIRAYGQFVAICLIYLYFNNLTKISRTFVGVEFFVVFFGFFVNRLIHMAFFHYLSSKEFLIRKVLIVGYNQMSKKLVNYLETEPVKTKIIGFCEDEENVEELSRYPVVANVKNVISFCRQNKEITDIYSTISPEQNNLIYKFMEESEREFIRFKVVPNLNYFIQLPVHMNYLKDLPVLTLRKEPLDDVANRIKKRIFDVCVSTGVIIFFLSWMIPLIGLIIWLQDRGPVFFIQGRSGKDNKIFPCLKFRSMRVNNEANLRQARRNDDRITPIGKFLRRTSLDEFPQFLNVFMSHMSIIGPRPHMIKHTEEYSQVINNYMVRHYLKPGITGWAQVNGYRGEITDSDQIKKRVEYDLWYLENWSLWLDIKIMFLTVYNIFKGEEKAY